jgi:hypothetical protein
MCVAVMRCKSSYVKEKMERSRDREWTVTSCRITFGNRSSRIFIILQSNFGILRLPTLPGNKFKRPNVNKRRGSPLRGSVYVEC